MENVKGNWVAWIALAGVVGLLIINAVGSAQVRSTFGAAGGMLAENYIPYIMYNDGYKSEKGIVLSGANGDFTSGDDVTVTDDLTVTDDTTLSSDLTVAGSATTTGTLTVGTGSWGPISQVNFGTCIIHATSQTIAASSTQEVSCQSAAASAAPTALVGTISAGDLVFMGQPTTTPVTSNGLIFQASASSTDDFIHMRVINNTGGTFTWTAAATTGIPYFSLD